MPQPPRLKRSESFLGIHFNFHATVADHGIGTGVSEGMVEAVLQAVQPDYVQCDCKGHPGVSSYPTTVGHPAPEQVRDSLRIWREITARAGVSLYMHYSGVWDAEAVKHHPEWARVDEHGVPDPKITSVFGPYVDQLLIPQLKELADVYEVDGVWVDGECWATLPDWAPLVVAAFTRQTGIAIVPRQPGDPGWAEFRDFCRQGFRNYLKHYVDVLHAYKPGFEIASNWAYSSFMPEAVGVDVDFVSGDFTLQDSVNAARFEGRCLARQGKPWDLMAWAFSSRWLEWSGETFSTKSVVQLQQEAAQVLALGGGFQAYFQQKRDGSVALWQMELMRPVAEFCRARQVFCHRAEAVPQVGLIYSGPDFYRQAKKLFAHWHQETEGLEGILQNLLDCQLSVEILMEHHLDGRLEEYRLLVVPEWAGLGPGVKDKLLAYARQGGQLLVIGVDATQLFAAELGVSLEALPDKTTECWLDHDGWLAGIKSRPWQATARWGTQSFGQFFFANDRGGPAIPAATVAPYGQGRIAGLYLNWGERYLHARTATARDFLGALVAELLPDPLVSVTGSHCVDVAVNRIKGQLAINLVNTAGPHADKNQTVFNEIPPVGPLAITIRLPAKPRRIIEQPLGRELPFAGREGAVFLELPLLAIHTVLMVEEIRS